MEFRHRDTGLPVTRGCLASTLSGSFHHPTPKPPNLPLECPPPLALYASCSCLPHTHLSLCPHQTSEAGVTAAPMVVTRPKSRRASDFT